MIFICQRTQFTLKVYRAGWDIEGVCIEKLVDCLIVSGLRCFADVWVMPVCDLEKHCKPERLFFGACLLLNWLLMQVALVANIYLALWKQIHSSFKMEFDFKWKIFFEMQKLAFLEWKISCKNTGFFSFYDSQWLSCLDIHFLSFLFSFLKNPHEAFLEVAAIAMGRIELPATVAGEGWM